MKRLRNAAGHFLPRPALERFREKCEFDAVTGCVLWVGGTTCGGLKSLRYGSFWDGGRRWFAHRWAAKHILGLDIEGKQVDHCCPSGPNTLCVHHLQAVDQLTNLQLQWGRRRWGWDEWEAPETALPVPDGVPFYSPPSWLTPWPAPSIGVPF